MKEDDNHFWKKTEYPTGSTVQVYKVLLEKTKSTPGAKVENNKFCLSVHFRCVDEKV